MISRTARFLLTATLCTLTQVANSPFASARPSVPIAKPAPQQRQKFDTTRFIPETDLWRGEKGYALTVFHGQKIESFNVTILGVLKKVNNGKDLILIKVTSGPSVTRGANIAHGMSGSPVYIGKRMVGAIAYSIPFAKEPIGLVTPIGDMLDAWDPDLPAKPTLALGPGNYGESPNMVSVSNTQLSQYLSPNSIPGGYGAAQDSVQFTPLATPLMVTGMSQGTMARLSQSLAPFGLIPMAGGGSGSDRKPTAKDMASLVPGSAVGVSLVQGDIDETAIGTLTYRDGNRVIAFGHPFTGIGPIDAALTTATITDIFPSVEDSIKLGAPDVTVGRIFQDRPFSVGGLIGSMPQMIPVTVHIDDESDKRSRTFSARVINHPLLTGKLITTAVMEAIAEVHGSPGDAIATVKMDVDAEQVGHIIRSNVFYDPLSINETAVGDLDSLLGLLSANPFYPLAVRSVDYTITIESKHDTAEIDHIYVPKVRYQPGDTVEVGVVVKPYKQDPVLRKMLVKIPSSTPDGPVTITVRGGAPVVIDIFGLTPAVSTANTANVEQVVHKFLEQPKNNDLVATLTLPTTALSIQGEKLSLLPPSLSAIMRSQHTTGLKLERDDVKVSQTMPWVMSGAQTIALTVARKNPLDTATDMSSNIIITPTPAPTPDGLSAVASADGNDDDSNAAGSPARNGLTVASDGTETFSPDAARINQPTGGDQTLDPAPTPPMPPDVPIHTVVVAVPVMPDSQAPLPSTIPDATPSSDTTTAASSKAVPVSRVAQIWRQDTSEEFAAGTLNNVALTSANDLRLAASPQFFASSTASYIWSLATDSKGNIFAGTGDDGIIYKTTPTGTMTPFYRTGEIEVSSLVLDRQTGDLYAGTLPHGYVFRITPDGKGAKVFAADEKYVTALALDSTRGKLYIATGGGTGRVYSAPIADVASAKPFWTSQEAHILSLAVDSQGIVYAGAAPDGLVYAITPDGIGKILYTTGTQSVSALAVGKNDVLYAGTSPRGQIYKLIPSTWNAPDVKPLFTKTIAPVYGIQTDRDGNVWASAGNTLYSIASDSTVLTHTASSTDVQLIGLTIGDDGAVYAGTSDIGQIYSLGLNGSSSSSVRTGTYLSPVHDAKLPSRWGSITWDSVTPDDSSVTIQTRTGDVAKPDETWSDWSAPYTNSAGQNIESASARYIQYKATFTGHSEDPANRATLSAVNIYYLSRNQAPKVTLNDPDGGDALSGDYTVDWTGSDPDHDTLQYDLSYSTNATDWKLIKPTIKPVASAKPATPLAPTSTAPAKTTPTTATKPTTKPTAIPTNPPSPPTIPTAPATPLTPPAHVMGQSQTWSTKDVPDGKYWLKVTVSDQPSNAAGFLTADSTPVPVLVDNTPPTVTVDPAHTVDANKQLTLTGTATGKLAFITAVQYKLDDQTQWYAAAAVDTLFDSTSEPWTLTTSPLTSGTHKVTVQALNQAGNTSQQVVTVTIP